MTIVFDFPNTLTEKIEKVDELIEKGYVDQAICVLEQYLEQSHLKHMFYQLNKRLLTCYIIKMEMESAKVTYDGLVSEQPDDIFVMAHHVLLMKWEGEVDPFRFYRDKLGVHSIRFQSLSELVTLYDLSYQEGWQIGEELKIKQLKETKHLEEILPLISDLQYFTPESFKRNKEALREVLQQMSHPIAKTSLFELFVSKEMVVEVDFETTHAKITLQTVPESIAPLHEVMQKSATIIASSRCVDEELVTLYTNLFWLWKFPFQAELDALDVVFQIFDKLEVEYLEKNDIIVSRLENKPILSQSKLEVESFFNELAK